MPRTVLPTPFLLTALAAMFAFLVAFVSGGMIIPISGDDLSVKPTLDASIPEGLFEMERPTDHLVSDQECLVLTTGDKAFKVDFDAVQSIRGEWSSTIATLEVEGTKLNGLPVGSTPIRHKSGYLIEKGEGNHIAKPSALFTINAQTLPLGKIMTGKVSMDVQCPFIHGQAVAGRLNEYIIESKACTNQVRMCRVTPRALESMSELDSYLRRLEMKAWLPNLWKTFIVSISCFSVLAYIVVKQYKGLRSR